MSWTDRTPRQLTTTSRGYGATHQRLRRTVAIAVQAGRAVCWRCDKPIRPGAPWHLGHDDDDRRVYRGPEHPSCNLGAAGKKARRLQQEPKIRRMTRW